jgi:hypothetical protein
MLDMAAPGLALGIAIGRFQRPHYRIADELVVTLDTVKRHVSHIFDKLGTASRTEAIARARELRFILRSNPLRDPTSRKIPPGVAPSRDCPHPTTPSLPCVTRAAIRARRRPPWPPCIEVLDIIRDEPDRLERLWSNTRAFKEGLHEFGFDTGASETPITPVITWDEEPTQAFARRLFEEGVFCPAIVFPTVAQGQARVRTIVTADHTAEDLAEALEVFGRVGGELGLR